MDTPDVALAQAGAVGAEAEPQGSPHHSNPTTCPATVCILTPASNFDVTGVACVSGLDFDRERGHSFVRFSFCGSTETCEEAVRLLRERRDEWQKH